MTLQLNEAERRALETARLATNQWLNRNVRDEGMDIPPEQLSPEVRMEADYKRALVESIDKVFDSMGVRQFICLECEKELLRSETVFNAGGESLCKSCFEAEEGKR